MTEPQFDPSRGRLTLAEPALAALVAHAADLVAAALESGAAEHLGALQAAGVIEGGRAHSALADALRAIVRPELGTLELSHSGKALRGWVAYGASALLLPAAEGDDRRTLLAVHPTLLPEALARLVDLAPRPRPPATAPVDSGAAVFGTVTRRWRLTVAWTTDDGAPGGGALEVLDAETGLWLLTQELAWPISPTFAWRHIVRLLMRRPLEGD